MIPTGQIGTCLRLFWCYTLDLCPGCHSSGRQEPQVSWGAIGTAGCKGLWLIPDSQHLGVHIESDVFLGFLCTSDSKPVRGDLSLSCLPTRAKLC